MNDYTIMDDVPYLVIVDSMRAVPHLVTMVTMDNVWVHHQYELYPIW